MSCSSCVLGFLLIFLNFSTRPLLPVLSFFDPDDELGPLKGSTGDWRGRKAQQKIGKEKCKQLYLGMLNFYSCSIVIDISEYRYLNLEFYHLLLFTYICVNIVNSSLVQSNCIEIKIISYVNHIINTFFCKIFIFSLFINI